MKTFITTKYKELIILFLVIFGAGYKIIESRNNEAIILEPEYTEEVSDGQIIDTALLVSNYKNFTEFKIVNNRLEPVIIKENLFTEVIKYIFYEIEDREQELRVFFKQHNEFNYSIKIEYLEQYQLINLAFIENTP